MKNLVKTFAFAGLLIASSFQAFAIDGKEKLNNTVVENVVDEYINSTVKGNTTYAKELFSDKFIQKFQSDENQAAFSKEVYLKHIKANEGISFDCDTEYQLIEKSDKISIAKVTMKFKNFTRTDYVTMNQEKDGWKVKEVNSVFR